MVGMMDLYINRLSIQGHIAELRRNKSLTLDEFEPQTMTLYIPMSTVAI
jgi:hypothetical protein